VGEKLKCPVDAEASENGITSPASTSASPSGLVFDGVVLPGRRSKLGQEQTGSADNLTLTSPAPAGKKARASMAPVQDKLQEDQEVAWSAEVQ
jgi:hypothetical protein